MDEIDWMIIDVLKTNARETVSKISKIVHLSVPSTAERIKKLESNGIIDQYIAKINRKKTGQRLLAFVFLNIDKNADTETFYREIEQQSCVLECHHVAGSYDYLLKVLLEDTQALDQFLSKVLKQITGVRNSNTIITLNTVKEDINA